ncbi:STAS/SEC14 domain-containing protein [Halomonas aquatica]|uniref:STAS/SEC14 domain-containing protein n=1 Tax=Halomonas aquatica TaxID=3151123 RepID=A0ABV1NC12_9GAMM
MLELIPGEAPHVVALRASGKVDADDLQQAIDAIEQAKQAHPKVSLYAEIDDMRWMTFTALLRDLGYGLTQIGELSHYHRVAMVTDHSWLRPLAELESRLFRPLEVRVFPAQERAAARAWILHLPEAS